MKIAIIIVHFGKFETTKACLKNLRERIGENRVILVNNTKDDVSSLANIIPGTKIMGNGENHGFAAAVNQGMHVARKDKSVTHVFLMNNDVSLVTGSFNQLLLTFNKFPSAGIVSPVLHHAGGYDWGGTYNKWTGMVQHKNWENKPKTIQTVEHVAGAAMLISREVIEKIGLFDERFFLYFEDLDFCLRAHAAGFTIHINPEIVAEHQVSAGTKQVERLMHQWRAHLQFITKYLGKTAYPTTYFFDLIFYPLALLKASIKSFTTL